MNLNDRKKNLLVKQILRGANKIKQKIITKKS